MNVNVHGKHTIQAAAQSRTIYSVRKYKPELERETKEDINVCLNCKRDRDKCNGNCRAIEDTRK